MAQELKSNQKEDAGATISCPGCGHTIGYYDEDNSSYYGCPKCFTFFKYEYEGPAEVLRQFHKKYKPRITIGSKGFIDGKEYTVIGYMRKNEEGETQQWDEYVLYRKNFPYVVLVEYGGNWVAVRKSGKVYEVTRVYNAEPSVMDDGEQYELYHSYRFSIVYACGEFDWNVLEDEQMMTYEYMSDTKLLVNEVLNGRSEWYWGTDMSARQVSQAFNSDAAGDRNAITAPGDRRKALRKFTIIMVVLIIAVQLLLVFLRPQKTVLDSRYMTEPDTTAAANIKPVITESFNLSQNGGVNIGMLASVDNEWVELSVTMINEQTGMEYESSKAIEYYHGYEDGETWSEGDKKQEISFSRVPAGKYHLNIYPYSDVKKYMNIDVTVSQNKLFYSNLLLMLFAVLLWPVLRMLNKSGN